jgi:hypothetical protein
MGTKDNAKGSVFIQYPRPKSTQKAVPIVAISDKEENMTTKEVGFRSILPINNIIVNRVMLLFKVVKALQLVQVEIGLAQTSVRS